MKLPIQHLQSNRPILIQPQLKPKGRFRCLAEKNNPTAGVHSFEAYDALLLGRRLGNSEAMEMAHTYLCFARNIPQATESARLTDSVMCVKYIIALIFDCRSDP